MAGVVTIDVEILEDGTISVTTGDAGSGTVHVSADQLLADVGENMGGKVHIKKREGHHKHVHIRNGQRIVHAH